MNWKQILLGLVLVDFSGMTAYAVYQHGYIGFFELLMANAATLTVLSDLCIALSLVMFWMWQDARERGVSVFPYLIVTLALGSIGPLLYLIVHATSERSPSARLVAQTR